MDLKLSTSLMYGLSALTYMATHHSDRPVMVREICRECGLPYDSTMKVMRQLTRARLVNAHRGSKGGFTLRVAATDINFLKIVEAIEGPIETGEVAANGSPAIGALNKGTMKRLFEARHAVEDVYRHMTLTDFISSR